MATVLQSLDCGVHAPASDFAARLAVDPARDLLVSVSVGGRGPETGVDGLRAGEQSERAEPSGPSGTSLEGRGHPEAETERQRAPAQSRVGGRKEKAKRERCAALDVKEGWGTSASRTHRQTELVCPAASRAALLPLRTSLLGEEVVQQGLGDRHLPFRRLAADKDGRPPLRGLDTRSSGSDCDSRARNPRNWDPIRRQP